MGNIGPLAVSVVMGIIGLAMVAVLVSTKANTQNVLTGAGSALSGVISAAVAPVTGQSSNTFGSSG